MRQGARVVVVVDGVEVVRIIDDAVSVDDDSIEDLSVRTERFEGESLDDASADESSKEDAWIEDTSVDKSNADESVVECAVKRSSVDDTSANDADTSPTASRGAVAHLPLGQKGTDRCTQRPTLTPLSSETVFPIVKHGAAGPKPKDPSAV